MRAPEILFRLACAGLLAALTGCAVSPARAPSTAGTTLATAAPSSLVESRAIPEVTPAAALVLLPAAEAGATAPRLMRRGRPSDPCCTTCPRLHLTLGAWIWGLDGTLGGPDREADVESSWTDTLEAIDKLDFALNARARYEWGRFAATLEVDGAKVSDTATFRRLGADIEGEASVWTLQGQFGYRFKGPTPGCGPCAPTACHEAYVGARAYWTDLSVQPGGRLAPLPALESSHNWIDPLVGLRTQVSWPSGWLLLAEGDVGGFGLASDLSWHLLGSVGRRLSRSLTVHAGWKILDVDYQTSDFTFDVRMSGPFAALTLTL